MLPCVWGKGRKYTKYKVASKWRGLGALIPILLKFFFLLFFFDFLENYSGVGGIGVWVRWLSTAIASDTIAKWRFISSRLV